jgi:hypothetical protein
MRANWGADARHYIAEATKHLPETATIKERRSALRGHRDRFSLGTKWGEKVWSREVRKYLEKHGLPPKTVHTASQNSRLHQRLKSGDIVFPFRGEQGDGEPTR